MSIHLILNVTNVVLMYGKREHLWLIQKLWPISLIHVSFLKILFGLHAIFHFSFILFFYFTILYWFCCTLTWICYGCTCVPHPEPSSHLSPYPIPLGHPSAPALSTLYHALNLDWWFVSHVIIYMFQCHSLISSNPFPHPQSPKDCSIHLCLFCCLAYRLIVTIFLTMVWSLT